MTASYSTVISKLIQDLLRQLVQAQASAMMNRKNWGVGGGGGGGGQVNRKMKKNYNNLSGSNFNRTSSRSSEGRLSGNVYLKLTGLSKLKSVLLDPKHTKQHAEGEGCRCGHVESVSAWEEQNPCVEQLKFILSRWSANEPTCRDTGEEWHTYRLRGA